MYHAVFIGVYRCAKTQVFMVFMVYRLSRFDAVIVV